MSVILTLMRTNASMIEVNACNSASAMNPQFVSLIKQINRFVFWGGKSEQVAPVVLVKGCPGPRLLQQICSWLFAWCIPLRTRRFDALSQSNESRRVRKKGGRGDLEGSD